MHSAMHIQRGITLMEMLITMTIAVILLTVGVPSFIDMVAANKASGYANDLLSDINLARSEAITRGNRVVICKGPTGTGCTTGNWEDGWKVFVDCNNNQTVDAGADSTCSNAADEEVLRVHAALTGGWTLRGGGNAVNRITFLPDGRTGNNDTLVVCKDGVLNSGNQTRSSAVVVNTTGRARVVADSNKDGVPDGVADCNL